MAIADSRIVHSRLHVLRSDDMTVVDISDWVSRVEIELGDLSGVGTGATGGDGVVRTMRFRVHNQTGADRFSPLDTSSSWNDFGGNYEPLLWPNRQVLFYVALQDMGDPVPSFPADFDLLFHGYIGDEIHTGSTFVECQLRDLAKQLQDTFIETPKVYAESSFTPVQTVMQEILNDNLSSPQAIYSPTAITPDREVKAYRTEWQSVWDALQDLAAQSALWLGYKYDSGTGAFRLTLLDPPRSKNTPDHQLSYLDDIYVHELDITDRNVRNVVVVEFRRDEDGERVRVTRTDPTSIANFGRRAMQIEEGSTSIIKTQAAAERFADAALADLADLTGTTRIDMPLYPQMELFDALEVTDPLVATAAQFYGVESIRHTLDFDGGRFRTAVVCSGRVVGAHKRWLVMQARPGSVGDPVPNDYPVRTNTVLTVAASDAPEEVKRRADIVCDGIEDNVEIQAAIDRVAGGSGVGKVLLTEGTFHIAEMIEIPSNMVIQGQGSVTVLRVVDDAEYNQVLTNDDWMSGNTNITITDLAIDGNKASQPGITDFQTGVFLQFCTDFMVRRLTIFDMLFDGVAVDSFSDNGQIDQCQIYQCEMEGIFVSDSQGVTLSGNTIRANSGNGIHLAVAPNCTVTGNPVSSNGSAGILVELSNGVTVTGNTVTANAQDGIVLSGTATLNCTVTANTVRENGFNGILLTAEATDNVICDNNCEKNGEAASNTYDNILIEDDAASNDVQGNVCRFGLGGQTRYGIAVAIDAGVLNFVTNNDLLDAGVAGDLFIGEGTTRTEPGNRLSLLPGSGVVAFRWMHSTSQSVSSNNTLVLGWDDPIFDTDSVHGGGTQTGYTVPEAGIWHFLASIRVGDYNISYSPDYRFRIKVNANTIVEQYVTELFTTGRFPRSFEASGIWLCSVNDVVTVELEIIGGSATQDVLSVSSITPLFMGYKIR